MIMEAIIENKSCLYYFNQWNSKWNQPI